MSSLGERFIIEHEIGSGGMARVFLSIHEELDRRVAVKVLKPDFDDPEMGDRFRREGRMAARLSHPNVVQVYDAGEGELWGEEAYYVAMEYIPGGDLKRLVDERGPLPGEELSRVGVEVAAGLAHAHEQGIVHRDVKPHNILLDEDGRAKLTDFGIARALDMATQTGTGSFLGTEVYSSPEQLQGYPATPKSDVYSLGVTLYYAATRKPPFCGSPLEVANQHVSVEPVPPQKHNGAVSKDLQALILACLAKNPADRPDAAELHGKLLKISAPAPGVFAGALGTIRRIVEAIQKAPRSFTAGGSGPFTGAMSGPARTLRPDRRRRIGAVSFVGVAAVLVLFMAVLGLLGMLHLDSGNQASGSPVPSAGGREGRQEEAASRTPPETAAERTADSEDLTAEAAGSKVANMYLAAVVRDDYEGSYQYLSRDYQRRAYPSVGVWARRFEDLQAVRFLGEPSILVSGNTATVEGRTESLHSDRIQVNTSTWKLVAEDGEWKIDDINVRAEYAEEA